MTEHPAGGRASLLILCEGCAATPSAYSSCAMQPCVLLKFGEIVLKGRNRAVFYAQLRKNVVRQARDLGRVELRQRGGVLALVPANGSEALLERARDLLGVTLVHPAVIVERTPPAACDAAVELLRGKPGATFAVRAQELDRRVAGGRRRPLDD